MLSKNDLLKLYDTVLSIPGMKEPVKVDLRMPRKNVLLLSKVIQRGLAPGGGEGKEDNLLDLVAKETLAELGAFSTELLQKAGLSEMNEKLDSFGESSS
ncbi:MAG: hypothetical protein JWP69_1665 [Flaviaesturariibacter sp.]|nr:hypothetical protein [Flaviaesturariibacter sp.]